MSIHRQLRHSPQYRYTMGKVWLLILYIAVCITIIALAILLLNIINQAFGFVLIENERDPAVLAEGRALEELNNTELISILETYLSRGLMRRFHAEKPLAERSTDNLRDLVYNRVVNPSIIKTWPLFQSLFQQKSIRKYHKINQNTTLQFRNWISIDFLISPQDPTPAKAGARTAFLGSMWMVALVIIIAFPIGVSTAVYLEEYTQPHRWISRLVSVNIYNLAGVPSIVYGMLGLAVFVRIMEPFTSGSLLGYEHATTGRTVLAAGMTLSLLVLPVIIISSREAIKSVPHSLRESSYALGATKWQTIWHHILPYSFERILTGIILSVSRAIGETAPLVVIGASTFITVDPNSLFSRFTTLPIQIYQWSARPQEQFRNVAAAAIIVLLALMLSMNAFAIIARNRLSKKRGE